MDISFRCHNFGFHNEFPMGSHLLAKHYRKMRHFILQMPVLSGSSAGLSTERCTHWWSNAKTWAWTWPRGRLTWSTGWVLVEIHASTLYSILWKARKCIFFPPKEMKISLTWKRELCFICFILSPLFLLIWNEGTLETCTIQGLGGTSNIC